MAGSARLQSLQALQALHGSLAQFRLDATEALADTENGIRRLQEWLDQQRKHWQQQVQHRNEEVARAKRDLEERKLAHFGGHSEQEILLRKARKRLEEAEAKVERCRHWIHMLPQHVNEYLGPARALGGMLDAELVRAMATVAQKIELVTEYTSQGSVTPPPPTRSQKPDAPRSS